MEVCIVPAFWEVIVILKNCKVKYSIFKKITTGSWPGHPAIKDTSSSSLSLLFIQGKNNRLIKKYPKILQTIELTVIALTEINAERKKERKLLY